MEKKTANIWKKLIFTIAALFLIILTYVFITRIFYLQEINDIIPFSANDYYIEYCDNHTITSSKTDANELFKNFEGKKFRKILNKELEGSDYLYCFYAGDKHCYTLSVYEDEHIVQIWDTQTCKLLKSYEYK